MESDPQSRYIKTSSRGNFFTGDKQSISPTSSFCNSTVQQIPTQKKLGIRLDEGRTIRHNISEKVNKANKCNGIIRKLNSIPHSPLY